jgi:hypothetical protein
MARPAVEFDVAFQIEFVEISEEEDIQFDAGICLLLQWIKKAINISEALGDDLGNDIPDSSDLGIAVDGNALVSDRLLQKVNA